MSSLSLKVISWNVGGLMDTKRLMSLAGTQGQITDQQAIDSYNEKITAAFVNNLLYGKDADIFCLQEFYPKNPDKAVLVEKFKDYTLLGQGDLAIAYKTDRFIFGEAGATADDGSAALYALLQDKITGEDICVVSDHVQGFNARTQKMYTRAKNLTPNINPVTEKAWEGRQQESAKEYKKSAPENGDRAIANSLKVLQEKFSPSLFVYGLDSNTAADYFPKENHAPRLHPKRLRQFTTAGWICDLTDKSPTIVDHSLDPASMNRDAVPPLLYTPDPKVQLKYDYVFAKSNWGHALTIKSEALEPTPDQFAEIPSDHRPVYATIQLKATWSSRAWSVFRFFQNLWMSLFGR